MKQKTIYWAATAVLLLIYLGGSAFYFTMMPTVKQLFTTIGYPTYLVPVLAVVKLLGVIAILSRYRVWLSDLAYAGMFYHLLLAISAHLNIGDFGFVPATVGLIALLVSFFTQNAARATPSPYGRWPFGATVTA